MPPAEAGPHPGRCWNPWETASIHAVGTARPGLLAAAPVTSSRPKDIWRSGWRVGKQAALVVEDGAGALPGRRVGAKRCLATVGCGVRWRACANEGTLASTDQSRLHRFSSSLIGSVRGSASNQCWAGRSCLPFSLLLEGSVTMGYTLQDPRTIRLSSALQQLLEEVTAAVNKLDKIRPLSPALALRLREALLPDRIVASLNMEGIVATRRQTLSVMDAMRVKESVGSGEKEIFNTLKADEFVHDLVHRGESMSEALIRKVNGLLLNGLRPDAGIFRPGDVTLLGARYVPPPGIAVPG